MEDGEVFIDRRKSVAPLAQRGREEDETQTIVMDRLFRALVRKDVYSV